MRVHSHIIRFMGGFCSADQQYVRHISDAQLYSLREMAEEDIDKMGDPWSKTCVVREVWIEEVIE